MSDTPNLDWLAADLHYNLWTAVLMLDAVVPCGSASAQHCGCCATDTVRMRQQLRRDRLPGRQSRMVLLCSGCDRAASGLTLPPDWT